MPIGSLMFGGAEILVCWKLASTVAPQSLYVPFAIPAAQSSAPAS
jgi:hypothetical protein